MKDLCIKCIKSKKMDSGVTYGQFLIDSLNPGQGITIGNLLRRILLSNLGGTAITGVRFGEKLHEFSIIENIREDLLEIMLNLKGVVLRRTSNKHRMVGEQYGRLKVQGPSIVTAKDIIGSPNLEIVNPNHYIATITQHSIFEMVFEFEYGIGYKLIDQTSKENIESDFLKIDSIFMPVQKVNFTVENVYKNNKYIYTENLFLEIWTNGSITPQEAIFKASQFIIDLFKQIVESETNVCKNLIKDRLHKKKIEYYDNISIEELHLYDFVYNCLKKSKINNLADLLKYSFLDLYKIKNFDYKNATEIFKTLKHKFGITLT